MKLRTGREVARQKSESQSPGLWTELNELAKAIALTLVVSALLLLMAAVRGTGL